MALQTSVQLVPGGPSTPRKVANQQLAVGVCDRSASLLSGKPCYSCKDFTNCLIDSCLNGDPELTPYDDQDPGAQELRSLTIDVWGSNILNLARRICPICRLVGQVFESKHNTFPKSQEPIRGKVTIECHEPCQDPESGQLKYTLLVWISFWEPAAFGPWGSTSWSKHERTSFVPLITSTSQVNKRYSLGRELRTRKEKASLIRGWVSQCDQAHGSTCCDIERSSSALGDFLVIDVLNECLVFCPRDCRYLALSYVWGSHTCPGARKANIDLLKTLGGLTAWKEAIPKTISDAMWLTKNIGERYLWVDLLCIVQDDSSNKHSLISAMDQVYGNASLTIVVTTGESADSGIFFDDIERLPEGDEIDRNIRLMPTPHDYHESNSPGNWHHRKRAWTFQEQLMSKRQIIFVDDLTFFLCPKIGWREDLVSEGLVRLEDYDYEILHPFRHLFHLPSAEKFPPLTTYMICVEDYSARNLTYSDDVMKAFSGISAMLETELGMPLLFGLPTKCFEWSLLWTNPGITRRTSFPSWSWAGWFGSADPDGARDVHVTSYGTPESLQYSGPAPWIEWHYWSLRSGQFEPFRGAENKPLHSSQLIGSQAEFPMTRGNEILDASSLSHDIRETTLACPQGRTGQLRFFTYSIVLEEGWWDSRRLYNRLGRFAGQVVGSENRNYKHEKTKGDRQEVIILSERLCEPDLRQEISEDVAAARTKKFLETHGEDEIGKYPEEMPLKLRDTYFPEPWTWSLYNVMLIEWRDGVAYRTGVGWIYWEALEQGFEPGLQWKEVTLG